MVMAWWYALGIVLYLIAAGLLAAEMLRPSKGAKSIAALIFVTGGVGIFFKYGIVMGWIGIGIAVVIIPTVVLICWKIFSRKYRGG